jgi:hypothetical protein
MIKKRGGLVNMLSAEKYKKIKRYYWIIAYIADRSIVDIKYIRFTIKKPKITPGMKLHKMRWYRPTWEELNNYNDLCWSEISK